MKVILHSQVHEWRETDEEGQLRYVRAAWDSRSWVFTYTTKAMDAWVDLEKPTIADYESLRDVLWRKYQRKRLSWKFVEDLDKFLVKLKG
jgi:hypothetical protein